MTVIDMRRDRRFYPHTPAARALRALKAERRAGKPFEPVYIPDYKPRPVTLGQAVRAILPGLGVLVGAAYLLACVVAFVAGWNS